MNAPTGSGKTYSLLAPIVEVALNGQVPDGLAVIWITPIRSLAKEIELAASRMIEGTGAPLTVGVRTGDTHPAVRQKQNRKMPHVLITTPESLHLLLSQRDARKRFKNMRYLVADEWHELLGSKRGVQLELAAAYLRFYVPELRVWGISATIGNLDEAMQVLLGARAGDGVLIRSSLERSIELTTLMPEHVERLPWAGHIGLRLIDEVVKVIHKHKATLIFTNTRAQSEIWYQQLLDVAPDLAGSIAMHHSAIDRELRSWVEDALYEGRLKAVVCTSSLDLGVDFRPVDAVIQIGGPKGVARFIQRAGRSGHRPGEKSHIYFLPTHALELIEAAALRAAIEEHEVESRLPYLRSFDVLLQFLTSLGVGDGFNASELFQVVRGCHAFASLSQEEWQWCLRFLCTGGQSLEAYPEYRKLELTEGLYRVNSRSIARRHRMSIGTIVGDTLVRVKYQRGKHIGHVEEYFAASLKEGDVFWFAGRNLEAVGMQGLILEVRNSKKKAGRVPAWQGGRLPLSSELAKVMRQKIDGFTLGDITDPEMEKIAPLLALQGERSEIPDASTLLVEYCETKDGHHLFFYPFAGRLVHEGLASLVAWRIGQQSPISFSMAFNDYGFELLSDAACHPAAGLQAGNRPDAEWLAELLSPDGLVNDLQSAINAAEMARRKFRDIAVISGMVFRGYPGAPAKDKHLLASSSLVFDVFADYDSDNLLLRQAFDEMLDHQLEIGRFQMVLQAIQQAKVVFKHCEKPTPLAFPIMVDRLRERLSSEQLSDRIAKMHRAFDA